ncbi:MAG: substrate-binding domain-containing protein [Bacteroidetes bacterium]|nr:substrate-binding domain-containing protein [Bacteroidota bacterium]
MKKRIIILSLTAFMLSGILHAQKSKNSFSKKKITIGFIGKIKANPVFVAAYSGAKLAAKELGEKYDVEIVVELASPEKENVQEQADAIDRFVLSKADGIAISCSNANFLTTKIDAAVEKGVALMCFDADAPKSSRFAYYGANDIEFGKMLIKGLAAEIGEKGTIAVLAGNKNGLNLQRRLQGIREELKKYPNIELPEKNIVHNLDIPAIASEAVKRTQNANPNIKGWIFITSSALQIKNSIKWKPGDVKIVAGNAVPAQLEYIRNGYVQALVGMNCYQLGYKSVEILFDKIIKARNPMQPVMYCPLELVKDKNEKEWSVNWNKWLLKEALK